MKIAKAGNTAEAVKMLMSALETYPRNVRFLTSAAVLEGKRNRVDEARALFNRGHLLEPNNAVLLRVRIPSLHVVRRCTKGVHHVVDESMPPAWG